MVILVHVLPKLTFKRKRVKLMSVQSESLQPDAEKTISRGYHGFVEIRHMLAVSEICI